jgi:type I restriction enzyme R subunit
LLANNRSFHEILVGTFEVEYEREDGSVGGAPIKVLDFENPAGNDWLAVNQFTVIENHINRRADIVLFVNGLPLAAIELKNPADANATLDKMADITANIKKKLPVDSICAVS